MRNQKESDTKVKCAFIFDLDGTLVDTQLPFHAKVESEILAKHNVRITPEELSERYAGRSTREIFFELLPNHDPDELVKEKWYMLYGLLRFDLLSALPQMLETCLALKANGIPICIASASPQAWIEMCIDKMISIFEEDYLLMSKFRNIFGKRSVSAEECLKPKPAPDVFLLAKKELALRDPKDEIEWYVVGDGEADVIGGLAAGMKVLYLSATKRKYDRHPSVTRFTNSRALAKYIINLIPELKNYKNGLTDKIVYKR